LGESRGAHTRGDCAVVGTTFLIGSRYSGM